MAFKIKDAQDIYNWLYVSDKDFRDDAEKAFGFYVGGKYQWDKVDLDKGFITVKDRKFELHDFPVMTLSISVAGNEQREVEHYGKIVDILGEMKRFVKSNKGNRKSIFVKDRRKSDL